MQNNYLILDEEEEEEQRLKEELTIPDNNNNNNTKLTRCNSSMPETGYWHTFKNIDCTGVFSTQNLFQEMLLPVCESSVSTFILAVCTAFTQWRNANWGNCFTVVIKDAVKFRSAIDTWRESIRVQRLMMQHLLAELLNYNYVHHIHYKSAVERSEIKLECCQDSQYHEQKILQQERQGVPTSTVQNNSKTWNKREEYEEEFMNKKYVEIAHTFALLYIVDKLWECDLSPPFRLAVTATEAPSYYKTIKDVVSLDHLYQNIYNDFAFAMQEQEREKILHEQNKPELEQLIDSTAEYRVIKCIGNTLDEHKAFDFVSLRERLAVLLRNCERFNEIGSTLALDAEKLVKLGNRLIREMQSEGLHVIKEHLRKINDDEDANNGYADMQSKELNMESVAGCNYILNSSQLEELFSCCNNLQMELEENFAEENGHQHNKCNKEIPAVNKLSLSTSITNKSFARTLKLKAEDDNNKFDTSVMKARAATTSSTKTRRRTINKLHAEAANNNTNINNNVEKISVNNSNSDKEIVHWMQCDLCHQWRVVPEPLNPLPEHWCCADINERCENKTTSSQKLSLSSARSSVHPKPRNFEEEHEKWDIFNKKISGRRSNNHTETINRTKIDDNNNSNGTIKRENRVINLHTTSNHERKHNVSLTSRHEQEATCNSASVKEDNQRHWFSLVKHNNSVSSVDDVVVDGKNENKTRIEAESERNRRVLKLIDVDSAKQDKNVNNKRDQETGKLAKVNTVERKSKRRRKETNSSPEVKEKEIKRGRILVENNEDEEERESKKESHRRKRARRNRKINKAQTEKLSSHTLHKHTSHRSDKNNRSKEISKKNHKRMEEKLPVTFKLESEVPLAELESKYSSESSSLLSSSSTCSSYSSSSCTSSFSRESKSSSSTSRSWTSSKTTSLKSERNKNYSSSSSYTSSTSSVHNKKGKNAKNRLSSLHKKMQRKHLTKNYNKKDKSVSKKTNYIQPHNIPSSEGTRKVTEQQISEMEVQMTTLETVSYNDTPAQILKQLKQMERKLRETMEERERNLLSKFGELTDN